MNYAITILIATRSLEISLPQQSVTFFLKRREYYSLIVVVVRTIVSNFSFPHHPLFPDGLPYPVPAKKRRRRNSFGIASHPRAHSPSMTANNGKNNVLAAPSLYGTSRCLDAIRCVDILSSNKKRLQKE